jgi:hypothetical protein
LLNGPLPKKAGDRLALADALIAIQKAREELRLEESAIASMLDIHWRGEKTDFVALQTIATTITSLMTREPRLDAAALIEIARHNLGSDYIAYLTQLVDLLRPIVDRVLTTLEPDLENAFGVTSRGLINLRSLTKRATAWASHQDRFDEWMRLYTADSKLRALNAAASADGLATGRIPASKAHDLLMSARSQAVWKQAVTATPQLREFYGPQHEERIGEFKSLEARRRLTNVEIVRGQPRPPSHVAIWAR